MESFKTFPAAQDARDYRHEHGTGGWIFEPDPPADGVLLPAPMRASILFPPTYTPSAILFHPFTSGRSGRLLGSA